MRKINKDIFKATVSHKIQLVAAIVVTVLVFAVPVFAWLSHQREIVRLQKVRSPNSLFLSAAHREDSVHFEVTGIDAEELLVDGYNDPILDEHGDTQNITHKDYVFSITGDAVEKFTIQLAYTTNNPFVYEVYAADELTASQIVRRHGEEFEYVVYELTGDNVPGMPVITGEQHHPSAVPGTVLYYKIDEDMTDGGKATAGKYTGRYLNGTAQAADTTGPYHDVTYATYTYVQADAEPVYWQATDVSAIPDSGNPNKEAFSRHFILRVRWAENALSNATKETDIVYISVQATR